MATAVVQNNPANVLQDWEREVHDLAEQVSAWAQQEPEWVVGPPTPSIITEDKLGTYEAPVVTIQTPAGRLILEPIARNFPGRGIVEFYAWPTLFRVRLLRGASDIDWHVRVDSGFILHQEWNRENFITLAHDLLRAS
jgi:hypothetical protein